MLQPCYGQNFHLESILIYFKIEIYKISRIYRKLAADSIFSTEYWNQRWKVENLSFFDLSSLMSRLHQINSYQETHWKKRFIFYRLGLAQFFETHEILSCKFTKKGSDHWSSTKYFWIDCAQGFVNKIYHSTYGELQRLKESYHEGTIRANIKSDIAIDG